MLSGLFGYLVLIELGLALCKLQRNLHRIRIIGKRKIHVVEHSQKGLW